MGFVFTLKRCKIVHCEKKWLFLTFFPQFPQKFRHPIKLRSEFVIEFKTRKIFGISLLFRYVHQTTTFGLYVCVCFWCRFAYCYNHNNCYLLLLLFHLLSLECYSLFSIALLSNIQSQFILCMCVCVYALAHTMWRNRMQTITRIGTI